jgi:hypothetical protein
MYLALIKPDFYEKERSKPSTKNSNSQSLITKMKVFIRDTSINWERKRVSASRKWLTESGLENSRQARCMVLFY